MTGDGIELFFEVLIDLVPRYFGAFLIWIYNRFKTPYSVLTEQDRSTTVGGISLGILTLLTFLILI